MLQLIVTVCYDLLAIADSACYFPQLLFIAIGWTLLKTYVRILVAFDITSLLCAEWNAYSQTLWRLLWAANFFVRNSDWVGRVCRNAIVASLFAAGFEDRFICLLHFQSTELLNVLLASNWPHNIVHKLAILNLILKLVTHCCSTIKFSTDQFSDFSVAHSLIFATPFEFCSDLVDLDKTLTPSVHLIFYLKNIKFF